jgi:hypothetical protein
MSNSLLFKSPSVFTADRPVLVRDPMIRPGAKFTLDFTDERCHPGRAIKPGAVPAGAAFASLEATPVAASLGGANPGITIGASGEIVFDGTGGSGQYLQIGSVAQFDASGAPYEYALIAHIKLPATGYTATDSWVMMRSGGSANDSQFYLQMGAGGLVPRFSVGSGSGSQGGSPTLGNITPGQVIQLGVRFDPGAYVGNFRDGSAVGTPTTSGVTSTLAANPSYGINFLNNGKFSLYRVELVNIDASLAKEATWGIASADQLSAAQHIQRDFQFCKNLLPAAPKTPFA